LFVSLIIIDVPAHGLAAGVQRLMRKRRRATAQNRAQNARIPDQTAIITGALKRSSFTARLLADDAPYNFNGTLTDMIHQPSKSGALAPSGKLMSSYAAGSGS